MKFDAHKYVQPVLFYLSSGFAAKRSFIHLKEFCSHRKLIKMSLFSVTVCLIANIHIALSISDLETKEIASIFEGLGFSPVCVASALASCERESRIVSASNFTDFQDHKRFGGTKARNCYELLTQGDTTSGIREVYSYDCCRDRKVTVFCDQTTDGGGWTVIQNRDTLPVREDFYRSWVEHTLGFGNVTGEFWFGLENIHALVSSTLIELRIDLEDYEGNIRWAKYGVFYIGDSSSKYTLGIGRYSGDAGDALFTTATANGNLNGMKFTTHDQDNDARSDNCASVVRGAWWHNSCTYSSLNGYQYVGHHMCSWDEIFWHPFRGEKYSLKKASMKIRPTFRK